MKKSKPTSQASAGSVEAKPPTARRYLLRRMAKKEVARRSYKIKLYGNKAKTDTARYTQMRFNQYCNMFLGRLFFGQKKISTKGLGNVANQALYRSNGIVRAVKAASKATGIKLNVPVARKVGCYSTIQVAKNGSFDYWITVANFFSPKPLKLPAKSHKAMNRALRDGWKMSKLCEFKMINGNAYALVFLEREVRWNKPIRIIGVDVGYKYSIATSEGHIGRRTDTAIRRAKEIHAERRRQRHKVSNNGKTSVKQILDLEAKRLVGSSNGVAFSVESPKRLANLRAGGLHGWARSYFANRMAVLCKENGARLIEVNPYQTSITCSKCQSIDKQSRVSRDWFKCSACGHEIHADVNGARNIALKGIQQIRMEVPA